MSSLRLLLSLLDPPLTRSITPFVWSRGSIPTHRIIPRSRQAPFCQVTPTITTVSFLSPHTLLFVGTKSATIPRALTPISENSRIPRCANTERKEIQRKTDTEDDDVLVDIRLGRLLFLILTPNVFTLHGIVSAPSISFLPSNEVLGKKVLLDLPSLMA